MFEKPLMLTGLKKQYRMLGELMEIAGRDGLSEREIGAILAKAGETASNLRRLRKIRRTYGVYLAAAREERDFCGEDGVRILAEQ